MKLNKLHEDTPLGIPSLAPTMEPEMPGVPAVGEEDPIQDPMQDPALDPLQAAVPEPALDPEVEGQLTQIVFQLEGVTTLMSKVQMHRLPDEKQERLFRIQKSVNQLAALVQEIA